MSEVKYKQLARQRVILATALGLMLLTNAGLVMKVVTDSDKTILVPFIDQEVAVGSIDYLGAMASSISSLLLNLNATNLEFKKEQLAKIMSVGSYQEVASYFDKQAHEIKKLDLSTYFDATDITIDRKGLRVTLKGKFFVAVNAGSNQGEPLTCVLDFYTPNGRLMLKKFKIIKDEKPS